MILLDTHTWLWWGLGEDKLPKKERDKIDLLAKKSEVSISAISIWEAEILERKSKIQLVPDFRQWILKATRPNLCKVIPVDVSIILEQRNLPEMFHGDPADRLIAATSLITGFPLATKDQKIIDSGACEIWNEGS